MKNLKDILSIKYFIELAIMLLLYVLYDQGGMIKYPVSLIVCVVFFWIGRKKPWSMEVLLCTVMPTIVYLLLGCFSTMLCGGSQMTTVKVLMYQMVPLVLAFSLYVFYEKEMKHIVLIEFVGCVLAYALFDAPTFMKIFRWESVFAFSFGLFALYYFYKKRWAMFVVSFLFLIFAEKRIALLAIFVGVCIMLMLRFFRYSKKLAMVIWSATIAAVYGYLYLIYSGIMDAFCWGANINTNGRVEMYSRMAGEFEFSPLFFGKGLGIVENLLDFWKVERFANLHNDLLKFYIELGFLALFIYLVSYFIMFYLAEKFTSAEKMSCLVSISVYTMILFATDNVSIYSLYLFPLFSIMFAVLSEKRVEND